MTAPAACTVVVLGASGLLGNAVALELQRQGFRVVSVARRFTAAQRFGLDEPVEAAIVGFPADRLVRFVVDRGVDVVVNCIGVLQDGPSGTTDEVHAGFVRRVTMALALRPTLLVHLSIPANVRQETAFSRSKRAGEDIIAASGLPYAILRPGFVVGRAAYGGSALVRALAATPFEPTGREAEQPFAVIGIEEVAGTVAFLASRWACGDRSWQAEFDLMHPEVSTFGEVVHAFRRWLGSGSRPRIPLPAWLLRLGARAGDIAGALGWRPPIRTNALREVGRGVTGDPNGWQAATGIVPRPLATILAERPATVQERWFARLYLLKPAIIASLVLFWVVSGVIALTVAFEAAAALLTARGFPDWLARVATVVSSIIDIVVGLAIAVRRTCRIGLRAGVAVSLLYFAAAALITPDLWIEPLGALVKTVPAIVLMLVAAATLDDR